MEYRISLVAALMAATAPVSAWAQSASDAVSAAPPGAPEAAPAIAPEAAQAPVAEEELPEEEFGEEEEIVITGQRERGAVQGDIPPEIQLDSRDIRAYGASDLSELLDALAPQIQSGRGREDGPPVVLLNGQRISGFREIRKYPPEAVERIDILPEEVALKYGYRADQRVVNIVLRRRFRTTTAEAEAGVATAGGRGHQEVEISQLRIDRTGRWNIDAEYQRDTALYESERAIQAVPERFDTLGNVGSATAGAEVDPALSALLGTPATLVGIGAAGVPGPPGLTDFSAAANVTDQSPFRTLLPSGDDLTINGTFNRTIFGNVSATINGEIQQTTSTSRFGLASGELLIPADNPYSPFDNDVILYRTFEDGRPLTRDNRTRTAHAGVAFNGSLKDWQWSLTGNYDRSSSRTRTDNDPDLGLLQMRVSGGDPGLNPFAIVDDLGPYAVPRDRTHSVNQSGDVELVASGSLFELPAGDVSTTIKVGAEARGFDSETRRLDFDQSRSLSRESGDVQVNLDVPIASRRRDVLTALGDLSFNANAAITKISDFGTLKTLGGGFNWSPWKPLRIIASVTDEEGAPSVQQLGNPVEVVPNVRVFDFVRGETVDITRIEGGNPALVADHRRVFKLGLNLKPLPEDDLSLRVDYTQSRTRNLIASFPTATAEIEAAFPERFERDEDGRLLSVDVRPVNFARADTKQIRWGINFSKPIASRRGGGGWQGWRGQRGGDAAGRNGPGDGTGAAAPTASSAGQQPSAAPSGRQAEGGAPASAGTSAAPGAEGGPREGRGGGWREGGGFGGGGFGGGGRGGRGQGGRLQFSLYHTWRLQDEVLIREGLPELDFLNGSATGSRGGRPRHEIEFQGGISKNGYGARLTARWQSGTTVNGDPGLGGTDELRFSDLTTLNLRLFADLGQQPGLVGDHPWLRGMRVTLLANNLLDSRTRVRDAAGGTPLSYQPFYLDPLGRTITLQIRKMFYPRRPRSR